MASPDNYIVVFCTTPSIEVAKIIATALVNNGAAACVNIVPGIMSIYKWEDKVHDDPEALMIIKSRTALRVELIKLILENHPYDVPEIIAVPIRFGHMEYLKWLDSVTNTREPQVSEE